MDRNAYRTFFERMKNDRLFVPIRKSPPNLSSRAQYGMNFMVGGKNCSWILDGDDNHGWVLYLDSKGDGDLSNAKPQAFKPVNGAYRLQGQLKNDTVQLPYRFELQLHSKSSDGVERLAVWVNQRTIRRGSIEIGGRRAPFVLSGEAGIYNNPYQSFTIDATNMGKPEGYQINERYLNLFGKSYEFKVNSLGDSLSLTELPSARADRPSLKVGSSAPEFSATDIAGRVQKLAAYHQRLVLVEFWSTNCGPCRAEAPRMVRFYKNTMRDKLDFLGITDDVSETALRSFLNEFGMKWPQIRDPIDGTLHRLYRISGIPAYYLIGPTGQILETWVGSGETVARVSKYVSPK
jgi:peroxiredoxin